MKEFMDNNPEMVAVLIFLITLLSVILVQLVSLVKGC
jgi:hypothetical protein